MEKDLILWNEAYSVNIPEIDIQHKKLIDLINRLYNSYLNKEHDQKIGEIIIEIKEYTHYHFTTEEELFAKKNYKHALEHRLLHKSFTEELEAMVDSYDGMKLVLTMKTMTLLQRWLTNHILKEDKKYMGYL